MEEIPDEDNKKNECTLLRGVSTLLMDDEEFKTLQQREKLVPKLSKPRVKS